MMRKIFITFILILTTCACLAPARLAANSALAPDYVVRTLPDGPLYVGNQVSFEVFDPSQPLPANSRVLISLGGKALAEEPVEPFGMGNRAQATFYWAWDTHGLSPGDYKLTFSLVPGPRVWHENITLHPAGDVPSPEPGASWKSVESTCCIIYYISGTDAENDLEYLKTMADAQAVDVESRFDAKFNQKIPLTFLPRTLGHGGFTSDGIYVSYLHNNYAGSTAQQITHHEMVHWLDGQLGGKLRPAILQEGLAVFLSDGHFKVEPILPRAAALISLGWYVPLRRLVDSFYLSQHETGYIEAAALISYLVTNYGWQAFSTFYRNIQSGPGESDSTAIDSALQANFAISLNQLEKNFLTFLNHQKYEDQDLADLQLTVEFYNTVRLYQQELDPSAYFLYAWLPDVATMRQRGIVADFLRHPASMFNRELEFLLVMADASLRARNYATAGAEIRAVNILFDYRYRLGN